MQHASMPVHGSSGLVDPCDRKVASSLSLFDADLTVCCCSMRWSNLVGRDEFEERMKWTQARLIQHTYESTVR